MVKLDRHPEVTGSHLLVAVGRTPNLDRLNLDQAGIIFDRSGIKQTAACGQPIAGFSRLVMQLAASNSRISQAIMPVSSSGTSSLNCLPRLTTLLCRGSRILTLSLLMLVFFKSGARTRDQR